MKQELLDLLENDADVTLALNKLLGIDDIEQDILELRRIEEKINKKYSKEKLIKHMLDINYEYKVEIQRILDIDEIADDLDQLRREK